MSQHTRRKRRVSEPQRRMLDAIKRSAHMTITSGTLHSLHRRKFIRLTKTGWEITAAGLTELARKPCRWPS